MHQAAQLRSHLLCQALKRPHTSVAQNGSVAHNGSVSQQNGRGLKAKMMGFHQFRISILKLINYFTVSTNNNDAKQKSCLKHFEARKPRSSRLLL